MTDGTFLPARTGRFFFFREAAGRGEDNASLPLVVTATSRTSSRYP
jgi:hypothetical protein